MSASAAVATGMKSSRFGSRIAAVGAGASGSFGGLGITGARSANVGSAGESSSARTGGSDRIAAELRSEPPSLSERGIGGATVHPRRGSLALGRALPTAAGTNCAGRSVG